MSLGFLNRENIIWILGYPTFTQPQLGNLDPISLACFFLRHIFSKLGAMSSDLVEPHGSSGGGGISKWPPKFREVPPGSFHFFGPDLDDPKGHECRGQVWSPA